MDKLTRIIKTYGPDYGTTAAAAAKHLARRGYQSLSNLLTRKR
tara:strand:- start:826 stop:954 length:129 start_codon:yes stop_codon:yes gene_type:complete